MEKIFLVTGLSFVTALSGALQPGPLLTFTVVETIKTTHRGWLVGAKVVLGHACAELLLLVLLVLGLAPLLQDGLVIKAIGTVGAALMLLFAFLTLRDVFAKKINLTLAKLKDLAKTKELAQTGPRTQSQESGKSWEGLYPLVGGALVSMSNPFWWVWWATVGVVFMSQYAIDLKQPWLLLAFFLGHEAGDLGWYMLVSFIVYSGRHWLTPRVYQILLILSALFFIGLAGWILLASFSYQNL